MALLTKAGNSALSSSVFHGLAGNFGLFEADSTLLDNLCLHSEGKRRMVIVSKELGGKQSHEIGPRGRFSQ